MKNFKKTCMMLVFALLLTGVFTLGGCEKANLDSDSSNFTEQLLSAKSVDEIAKISTIKDLQIVKEIEFLKKQKYITNDQYLEFHKTGKVFEGLDGDPFYAVDGKAEHVPNFSLTREYVQRMMKEESARHRRFQYMYSGGTISVKVHSNVPTEWATAVSDAISYWNGLGANIVFAGYSGTNTTLESNKIDIVWSSLSSMATTDPILSTGKFSERIIISSTNATVVSTTPSGRKVIAAHELGHAIGLMHTDVADSATLDVATSIGCGSGTTDSQSIMRQYVGKTSPWLPFTTCDQAVINYYWWSIA